MKTIQIHLYGFDELGKEAQQKSLIANRDINLNDDWWDSSYEAFISVAGSIGFEIRKERIFFRGFYSQGDGSGFDAEVTLFELRESILNAGWKTEFPNANLDFQPLVIDHRVWKLLVSKKIELQPRIICRRDGIGIVADLGEAPLLDTIREHDLIYGELDALEKWLGGIALTLNRFLYDLLETEYEYYSSDVAVREALEGNSMLFTSDGKNANGLEALNSSTQTIEI